MFIAALVFEFYNYSIFTIKYIVHIMKCKLPIKQIKMKEVFVGGGGGEGGGLEFGLTELCFPSPGL